MTSSLIPHPYPRAPGSPSPRHSSAWLLAVAWPETPVRSARRQEPHAGLEYLPASDFAGPDPWPLLQEASAQAAPSARAAERPVVIRCRGVVKEFGQGEARVQALGGVDLDVRAGEMTLLVGPSGCGKTTLLSVLAGILDPTQGEISILGTDLGRLSAKQKVLLRATKIGFVFQQYNLLPALTAAENAAVPLLIAGRPRREAVAKATAILEAVGLGSRAHALPAQLSGGQQQRVAIARALVHEPQLLVCDEPTAALDAQAGQKVLEILRRVAVQPDRAVLVVTHDNRVFRYGDRIVHMNDGRIERVEANQVH